MITVAGGFALSGMIFFILAGIFGTIYGVEGDSKLLPKLAWIALSVAVVFFLAAIWMQVLAS